MKPTFGHGRFNDCEFSAEFIVTGSANPMSILTCVCFLTLFTFTHAVVGECDASELGYECMKSLAEYYNVHWTLRGSVLHMALEGIGAEWVGFSFPQIPEKMFPADAVIGWLDVNGPSVLPYHLTTQSVFSEDEDFAIILSNVSAIQDTERTIVAFTRSTTQGRVKIKVDEDMPINFAIGDVDSLRYHRERGSSTILLSAEPGEGRTAAFRPPPLSANISPSPDEVETSSEPSLPTRTIILPSDVEDLTTAVFSAPGSESSIEAPESNGGEDEDDEVRLLLDGLK